MNDKSTRLTIQIDASLAKEYATAYSRLFPDEIQQGEPLAAFIARFVEDQLPHEIAFLEDEATEGSGM